MALDGIVQPEHPPIGPGRINEGLDIGRADKPKKFRRRGTRQSAGGQHECLFEKILATAPL